MPVVGVLTDHFAGERFEAVGDNTNRRQRTQYSPVAKSFFLCIHFPFVKSGNSTLSPPIWIEVSERGVIALHATASYTSWGVFTFFFTASTKALSTNQSIPPC